MSPKFAGSRDCLPGIDPGVQALCACLAPLPGHAWCRKHQDPAFHLVEVREHAHECAIGKLVPVGHVEDENLWGRLWRTC